MHSVVTIVITIAHREGTPPRIEMAIQEMHKLQENECAADSAVIEATPLGALRHENRKQETGTSSVRNIENQRRAPHKELPYPWVTTELIRPRTDIFPDTALTPND